MALFDVGMNSRSTPNLESVTLIDTVALSIPVRLRAAGHCHFNVDLRNDSESDISDCVHTRCYGTTDNLPIGDFEQEYFENQRSIRLNMQYSMDHPHPTILKHDAGLLKR